MTGGPEVFQVRSRAGSTHYGRLQRCGGGRAPILKLRITPTPTCGVCILRGALGILVGSERTSEAPPVIHGAHPLGSWCSSSRALVLLARRARPKQPPAPVGLLWTEPAPHPRSRLPRTLGPTGGYPTPSAGPWPAGPSKADDGGDLGRDEVGGERGPRGTRPYPRTTCRPPPPRRPPTSDPGPCPGNLSTDPGPRRRQPRTHRTPQLGVSRRLRSGSAETAEVGGAGAGAGAGPGRVLMYT